uniref:Dynein_attach_N domain-containing protein n=1 Tax=Parastrongyloides trichosuri TaxID=131310 RepID=A0A0N4ZE85_PARTI
MFKVPMKEHRRVVTVVSGTRSGDKSTKDDASNNSNDKAKITVGKNSSNFEKLFIRIGEKNENVRETPKNDLNFIKDIAESFQNVHCSFSLNCETEKPTGTLVIKASTKNSLVNRERLFEKRLEKRFEKRYEKRLEKQAEKRIDKSEEKEGLTKQDSVDDKNVVKAYSKRECKKILNLSQENFCIWLSNEIGDMLDIVQIYKNVNHRYELPDNCRETLKYTENHSELSSTELHEALREVYSRIVFTFVLQFSSSISKVSFRKGLINLCHTLKICLHSIIIEMEVKKTRLFSFLNKFDERYQKGQVHGEQTECLRDQLTSNMDKVKNLLNLGERNILDYISEH